MSLDTRDRLTDGINATRLRLETRRALPSVPVILLGVLVTLAGGALLFSQLTPTLFKGTRTVRVAIADAYGVSEGINQVRYRGVPAGTIEKIERRGTQLHLRLTLRKDLPLYRNARAELRPATPLNDMYLDFTDPGTASAGVLADRILPEPQTGTNVKIGDVLNGLQANTRTRLEQLLDNLGNGLADRGHALRAAVQEFTPFVARAGTIAEALAAHQRATSRLVHNAAILTTELGTRQRELRTLVRDGSATLGTLQEASPDLDRTLRELPPTVSQINASFAAVRAVIGDVDRVVGDLGPVADRLPDALRNVRVLNGALAPAAGRLQRPVTQLVPLVRWLRPVTADLRASVDALRPEIPSIDKITTGLTACEKGIIGFFQWDASVTKFGDARAPVARGTLAVGVPDVGVPGSPTRKPAPSCVGGTTMAGTVPTTKDEG